MKVGVVGLGRMGSAIAQRLAQNGFDVTGWDRDAGAARRSAEHGLRLAESPLALAAVSEAVITIVSEDSAVRSIYAGENGYLKADIRGKLFVEMTTVQPMTARELAPLVEAKGASFVESPVLGTIPSVRDGKLVALLGCAVQDVERARKVLDPLTRRVIHMGPVGAGSAMKLSVNLGLAAYVQALAESLALGMRQGLRLEQMLDVLSEAPTATGWLANKGPILKGEKGDVSLSIQLMRKDVMSAVATGALSGLPMPLSSGALASFSAAMAHGMGDADIGELPRFFRDCMTQDFK